MVNLLKLNCTTTIDLGFPRFWSVKFIKPGHFKYALCIDKNTSKSFLQRVCQGRSTLLANLGLHHSAVSPVFPTNVSNVHDLGDEEINFSMYDTDEAATALWDNSLSQEEEDFMEEVFERQRQEGNFYNRGEMPDSFHNVRHSDTESNVSDDESQSDGDTPVFRLEAPVTLSISLEGEIQAENESENRFNRGLRDEILQQQSRDSDQESDHEESQEFVDHDEFLEDLNADDEDDIHMWTAEAPVLPTIDDWARTIVNNNDANRDGWGDEIVSVMRNSSIDEIPSTLEQSVTSQDDNQNNDTDTPSVGIIKSPSNIIRCTSANNLENKKKETNEPTTLGEYLMISTGKDVMMMSTSTPKMTKIRAEYNIISKVDVRSDQMLSVLDRINMVEWLPELELYVAASQKGTVALMRILQVEFEGGKQACIFNNECYLPTGVLQSTPLYGTA